MKSEKRNKKLFETLVKSGDVEDQFERIIEDCKRKKTKYKDPEFYPQKSVTSEDESILKEHVWRRIEDEYPTNLFSNISSESIQQGTLGDCYFVSALIYASQHVNLVKKLFHPKSSLEYGCVLVYFYFLGEKVPVIIDTQIAYRDYSSESPLFCHPRTKNDSCWFVLVEKAFSKACGGYHSITSGTTHCASRLLFDYFSSAYSKMTDLIQEFQYDDTNLNFFETLLKMLKNKAMIGTSISDEGAEKNTEMLGLIINHAYYILDARKSNNILFIKLRNPWGIGQYRGNYSKGSDEWTKQLREDLDYDEKEDGSFWMRLENYFYYFDSISFSLPNENDWKEMSVYGKIEGYLDGRSPCIDHPNVGCIPQWSIKFTKKTIVRLSFDAASSNSYFGIYIVKNHGVKVNRISKSTEIKRSTTNSTVNGIEYIVEDFSEPYTFFFNRETAVINDPCYFRILIQSPDKDFVVKKFDDDFIKEKWNCKSDSYYFSNPEMDQWDPLGSMPLTTCRQWFINFPKLKKNEETEIRFRVFKNISEGPLFLFIAQCDHRLSYSFTNLLSYHFEIDSKSSYEEYSIPINKNNNENDSLKYIFSIYRNKQNDVNRFKFFVLSKSKFEFGLMKEPDPVNNCCYSIKGSLYPGTNDGASPYSNSEQSISCKCMKQWCLKFKKSPTTLFVEFLGSVVSSKHHVYLEIRDKEGQKIDVFYVNTVNFDFHIEKDCPHDQAIWKIKDISKAYSLCVTRDKADSVSDYTINIFGTEKFDMFEIDDNENLDRKADAFIDKKDFYYYSKRKQSIDFPEVDFVEQPTSFTPKRSKLLSDDNLNKIPKQLLSSDSNSESKKHNKGKYNNKFVYNSILKNYHIPKRKQSQNEDDLSNNDKDDDQSNSVKTPDNSDNKMIDSNINSNKNKQSDAKISNETDNKIMKIDKNSSDRESKNKIQKDSKNKKENSSENEKDNNSKSSHAIQNEYLMKSKTINDQNSNDEKKNQSNKNETTITVDINIDLNSKEKEKKKNKKSHKVNHQNSETQIKSKAKHHHHHKNSTNQNNKDKKSDNAKENDKVNTEEIKTKTENEINLNFIESTKEEIEIIQNIIKTKSSTPKNVVKYLHKKNIPYTSIIKIFTSVKNNPNLEYFFVLSEFNLLILKKQQSKKIYNNFKESLINLSSISLAIDNAIILQFKNNSNSKVESIEFTTENPNYFINSFYNHIKRILSSIELKRINFVNLSTPKSLFKNTSQSILSRLNLLIKSSKIEIPEKFLNNISYSLYSHTNSFVFPKIKNRKKIFPLLFNSILLNNNINQIEIKKSKNIYPLIFENIDYFENILHVKIEGPATNDVYKFIEKSKNIKSLSFVDHSIEDFYYLNQLMKKSSIHSVGFDSSISEKSLSKFISNASFNNLKYFRVSNMNRIDFVSCCDRFIYLSVLSLKSCKLSIGNVFETMMLYNYEYLEELDLSGNIGSLSNKNITFPKKLKKLFVNDVEWEINSLINFINLCSKSTLSCLSINRISFLNPCSKKNAVANKERIIIGKQKVRNDFDEFDDDCWNSFFSNLPDKMNSISILNWNSNKVNNQFVTFLLNSKNLLDVSFSRCSIFDLSFIRKLLVKGNIRSVIIRKIKFEDINSYFIQFKKFLSRISQMKSLKQIDLSRNKFDKDCFDILADSLINSKIEFIAIDDSNLDSIEALFKFLKKLKNLKHDKIKISYPIRDIQKFEMNQNQINALNQYLYQLTKTIEDRKKFSFFDFPEFPFLRLKKKFPQFLSKEQLLEREKFSKKQKNKPKMFLMNTEIFYMNPSSSEETDYYYESSNNSESKTSQKPEIKIEIEEEEEMNEEENKNEIKIEEEEEINDDDEENKKEIKIEEEEINEEETKKESIDYSYSYSYSYYSYSSDNQNSGFNFTNNDDEIIDYNGITLQMQMNKKKKIIYVDKRTIISKLDNHNIKKDDLIRQSKKPKD